MHHSNASSSSDLLKRWLRPADFTNDISRYKKRYVAGTREWLIPVFHDWLHDPQKPFIWLQGGSGLGKSVIAWFLSQNVPEDIQFGTIAFCRHNDTNKNTVRSIIKSIAYGLAVRFPSIKTHLESLAMLDQHDQDEGRASILHQPINVLLETLIFDSVKSLSDEGLPTIIMIDALDECGTQRSSERRELISAVKYLIERQSGSLVKLFVTSRPEKDIWESLEGMNTFELQRQLNEGDIRIYIQSRLQVFAEFQSPELLETCVSRLTAKADGVFLYARLACDQLEKGRPQDSAAMLELINTLQPYMDDVYERLLLNAYPNANDDSADWNTVFNRFKLVLGIILVAKEPITQKTIAELLHVSESVVGSVLMRIRSILHYSNQTVSLIHKSFKDYITERCDNPQFHVPLKDVEYHMAKGALSILIHNLKADLLGIEDPLNTFDPEDAGLPEGLVYACKYWAEHVDAAKNHSRFQKTLAPAIEIFASTHMLHWIEAMVILQSLDTVPSTCVAMTEIIKDDEFTHSIFDDCNRMIRRFRNAISWNPLQIYYTVLPFLPKKTSIYQSYRDNDLMGFRIVLGYDEVWSAEISSLTSHSEPVASVRFSKDGQRLVSGALDATAKIWSVRAWTLEKDLKGHSHGIQCVDLSPDGGTACSVSDDGQIKLWDVLTGQLIATLASEQHHLRFCRFAPDGGSLATGSLNGVICIWDMVTRTCIRTLESHVDQVYCMEYSRDGTMIACGTNSSEDGVIFWSTANGNIITGFPKTSGPVHAIAFSASNKMLASSTADNMIRIWSLDEQKLKYSFHGHDSAIRALVFSPTKNDILASGSDGGTIKLWDVETSGFLTSLKGHPGRIKSLDISPDGSTLASGSVDQTVRIWDIKYTNKAYISPQTHIQQNVSTPNNFEIKSIKMSRDLKRLEIKSTQNLNIVTTVWDLGTGKRKAWGGLMGLIGGGQFYPEEQTSVMVWLDDEGWLFLEGRERLLWLPEGFRKPYRIAACFNNLLALVSDRGVLVVLEKKKGNWRLASKAH
ncbi:uncharacterized protein BJ171DRAFT_423950 [Polychytrium aggregatum]|uniref:uncharacterized protein n=1 Tax=Polychytrium aggregatum TaxID=110093 RepID=UPI0022FE6967|nr:uncharacterized protein BJ171DRAFT_423950 [Polychytrium aggregatum]KAI9204597.1 hypothetical protein BJ171DRAFT_423950 [Polychytrium aggregatum]